MCSSQIVGMGTSMGQDVLQGEQNAETLNANADTFDAKAVDARLRGGIAEDTQRRKGEQIMGTQRAGMGASGMDVNSGTNAKIQEQTAGMTELDAQTIRSNALREAWGYEREAENARVQADSQLTMSRILMPGRDPKTGKWDNQWNASKAGLSFQWGKVASGRY